MAALVRTVFEIADRMGTECVIAEPFSNTEWVRRYFESLPGFFVHVSDIEKPFGIEAIVRAVGREAGEKCRQFPVEIQVFNTELMDQGLRPNFKEIAVLRGKIRSSSARAFSGP